MNDEGHRETRACRCHRYRARDGVWPAFAAASAVAEANRASCERVPEHSGDGQVTRAWVAFALSGIALGCAAVWLEIGISEVLRKDADEVWEKAAAVADPIPTD